MIEPLLKAQMASAIRDFQFTHRQAARRKGCFACLSYHTVIFWSSLRDNHKNPTRPSTLSSFLWQFQNSFHLMLHERSFFALKHHAAALQAFKLMPNAFGDVHAVTSFRCKALRFPAQSRHHYRSWSGPFPSAPQMTRLW